MSEHYRVWQVQVLFGDLAVAVEGPVKVEFTWHGAVRVEGYETRQDGVLVNAAWEIQPFTPENP